jgi:hypothetical protein
MNRNNSDMLARVKALAVQSMKQLEGRESTCGVGSSAFSSGELERLAGVSPRVLDALGKLLSHLHLAEDQVAARPTAASSAPQRVMRRSLTPGGRTAVRFG